MSADNKQRELLERIHALKYDADSLVDAEAFEESLARDLQTDQQHAMALLGCLLTRNCVRIIHDMGLVVNPTSKEARECLGLQM